MDHQQYYDNPQNLQPAGPNNCDQMMTINININSLISEVESRNVLWDRTNLYYTDRFMKRAAWQDVYKALNPNFDQLPKLQQLLIGNAIERRWRSLKESFARRVKYEAQVSEGSRRPPYVFHQQMDFLRKCINTQSLSCCNNEDCIINSQPSSGGDLKGKLTQFLESQNARDYHQNFFDSLLPVVRKFDDEQALSFRTQVLRLLQEVRSNSPDPVVERNEPDNSISSDYAETYQPHEEAQPGQSFVPPVCLSEQSTYVSQGPSSTSDSGIESPVCASSLIQSAVCVALNIQSSEM